MPGAGTSAHDFGDAFVRPIAVATGRGHVGIIKALIARGANAEATCWSNMVERGKRIPRRSTAARPCTSRLP
ncbi:unnamed protein product [Ectocarpus sp. 12 AP-2014]